MIVGFDFETHLIRPGCLAPPPVCLTYFKLGGKQVGISHAVLEADECETFLRDWLRDRGCTLVGANTAFDAAVAMERWPELVPLFFRAYDEGRVLDVQVFQQLQDIRDGRLRGYLPPAYAGGKPVKINYTLADLVKRHLGKDRFAQKDGGWRLRYSELADVPLERWPKEAVDYAIEDAVDTAKVYEAMLGKYGEHPDLPAQCRAALALHLSGAWGLVTDPAAVDDLERGARARYDELTELLVAEGLVRRDGTRNVKAARERIVAAFRAQKLEPPLTKKGALALLKMGDELITEQELTDLEDEYGSLDAAACADSGDEVLEAYAERVSLVTLLGTHVPDLRRGYEVCINPRYNVLVDSGRTSCTKGKAKKGQPPAQYGFQVQNPRRKGFKLPDGRIVGVRECFIARAG